MNTVIEKARHAMYAGLKRLQACKAQHRVAYAALPAFEDALEQFLEQLRQEQAQQLVLLAYEQRRRIAAEAEVKRLIGSLNRAHGDLSRKTQWMRAAVRENKRLRADNKAFRATQDEMLEQIAILSGSEALRGRARGAKTENECKGTGSHSVSLMRHLKGTYVNDEILGLMLPPDVEGVSVPAKKQTNCPKNSQDPVKSGVCGTSEGQV